MKFSKKEVLKIIGLALLSAVLFNSFSSSSVAYIYSPQQQEDKNPADKNIVTIEEAKKLFDEKKVLFLDARPVPIYKRGYIPGAMNVPYNSKEKEKLMSNIPKDDSLVVYCYSSRCNQARLLKKSMEKLGFTNVMVFDGGIKDWTKANYPLEKSDK